MATHTHLSLLVVALLANACTTAPAPGFARQDPDAERVYASGRRRAEARTESRDEQGWTGNVHFLIGGRDFDDSWRPVDDQFMFGLEADFRPRSLPLGVEVGFAGSGNNETERTPQGNYVEIEAGVGEIYAGPRLTLEVDERFHLYLGGGISLLFADIEQNNGFNWIGDDDGVAAGYLHGGAYATFGERFQAGVDVRVLQGGSDLNVFGVDLEAEYLQVALILGMSF